jgi:16S rRNA C967 or C1407 C5-methylase (RsmB/RsmF family)/predicted ribosome-associated RNA-binding protein Tma20
MHDLDQEWILETSRTTGFSVATINKLIEISYLQNPKRNLRSHINDLISSMQTPQKWFSIRINPIRIAEHVESDVLEEIKSHFQLKLDPFIANLQFLHVNGPFTLEKYPREIIVDKSAAESIMTGANLYIPGFIKPLPKFRQFEKFSLYGPNHVHIANGITQYSHKEILEMNHGIGIKTTDSKFKIPSYRDSDYFRDGFISDHSFGPFLACNLLMEYYQDYKHQTIFDVCSAPGHKTCALSEIGYFKLKNYPRIVSIDRSTKRLEALHQDIKRLNLQNIIVIPKKIEKLASSHPELLNTADLLIMDPPCSALGTRPKLSITHTNEAFRSFFLLQRRLVKQIVPFLKKRGILLYTTCTMTALENEGIVGIMKRKFGFELLDAHKILPKVVHPTAIGLIQDEISHGVPRNEKILHKIPFVDSKLTEDLDRYLTLTVDDARKLIRLNPIGHYSTGYFIALLQKKNE